MNHSSFRKRLVDFVDKMYGVNYRLLSFNPFMLIAAKKGFIILVIFLNPLMLRISYRIFCLDLLCFCK